jgi:extracellular factor (EF) 3-hydroxypalmitic acid methyl ester biosynthesis protein
MSSVMHKPIELKTAETSLRAKVKHYKKMAREIEEYLLKKPYEWGRFQSQFNAEVNNVFRDIMNFEKEDVRSGDEKTYKLKRIFTSKIRKIFQRGDLTEGILEKPYGYAGDFKIIEDVYENNPKTTGFDRLFDNYVQMSSISVAVRNRKDDFKRMITEFVKDRQDRPLRIMNLASGPCREVGEMLLSESELYKNVTFDCYDSDERAIKFASTLLAKYSNINFVKENAARMAFRKDIHSLIDEKYDLVYSTGLFDYFEDRLATRLIANLKKILTPDGLLVISNVRDKFSNPSVHFMEWVGEWELVYCEDDEFRSYFFSAGFGEDQIEPRYEQQGILQYVLASNK